MIQELTYGELLPDGENDCLHVVCHYVQGSECKSKVVREISKELLQKSIKDLGWELK